MEITNTILPPEQQVGRAEKNVSRLLHNLKLVDYLQSEDFYVRLENRPYIPLGIERHDEYLHLLHVLTSNGDAYIDSEMIYLIGSNGILTLYETACWGGFREHRGFDRAFAGMFSRNLLEQGFDKPDKPTKEPLDMNEGEFNFYWEQVWDESDEAKKLGRHGLVKEALIKGKVIPEHFKRIFGELIRQADMPTPDGIRMIFVHPLRRQAKPGSRDEGRMVSSFEIIPEGDVDRFSIEAPDRETAIARALECLKISPTKKEEDDALELLRERGLDDELVSIIKKGTLTTATISRRFFDSGCKVSLQQERLAQLGLIYPHTFSLTAAGVELVQTINGIEMPGPNPDSATSYKVGMKVLIIADEGQGETIEIDEVVPYSFCKSNQRIHGTDKDGKCYWTTGDLVRFVAPRSRQKILDSFVEDLCALDVAKEIVSSNDDSEMARQLLKRPVRDMLMQLAISRPSVASTDEYHTIGTTIDEVEDFIVEVVSVAERRMRESLN